MRVEDVSGLPVGESAWLEAALGHGKLRRFTWLECPDTGAVDDGGPVWSSEWLTHSTAPRYGVVGRLVCRQRWHELPAYLPDSGLILSLCRLQMQVHLQVRPIAKAIAFVGDAPMAALRGRCSRMLRFAPLYLPGDRPVGERQGCLICPDVADPLCDSAEFVPRRPADRCVELAGLGTCHVPD